MTNTPEQFEAIVVGAGQAGLAVSYHLSQAGIRHVVLERGRIGEVWRSQRWSSFRLNTPNWANGLPGTPFPGEPGDFETADSLATYFEAYALRHSLPVRPATGVTLARPSRDGDFEVRTSTGDAMRGQHIVVAAGIQNVPLIPPLGRGLPSSLRQLHSAEYIEPAALPAGAVLLVGGGQTGCQIAEDLVEAGRRVYMATSRVGRVPRRYRGQDIFRWLVDSGFYDVRPADLPDPAMQRMRQPQTSGVDGGRTISYWQLARDGVTLLGRLHGAAGEVLEFGDELAAHLEFADALSAQVTSMVDGYIARAGISAPPRESDPREMVEADLDRSGPRTLSLPETGITSLIWCTGFGGDFSWLDAAVFDAEGAPVHTDGVAELPGIYFVGFPWLSRRGSGVIAGVAPDAEHIAAVIAERIGAGGRSRGPSEPRSGS